MIYNFHFKIFFKMNTNFICDIILYPEYINKLSLVYFYFFKTKYCIRVPNTKNKYLKRKIEFLYLIEDYEYISQNFNFENLPNLKWLMCPNNRISILELNCPKLEYLDCSGSKILILNIQNSPCLKYLNYSQNDDITILNIKHTQKIKYLNCSDNVLITPYLLSKNIKIKYLSVSNILKVYNINNILECLYRKSLVYLDCSYNYCNNLDLKGFINLKYLFAEHNNLNNLDLKNVPFLRVLDCSYNNLVSINLEHVHSLKSLDCRKTNIDLWSNKYCNVGNIERVLTDCVSKNFTDFRMRF